MLRRYLQHLLRTARLDGLLAKHTEMLSEIKNLDSDMQMLVYENYNRFISATDTVRTMKSNVDGMDSSMQDLEKVTGTTSLYYQPARIPPHHAFCPLAFACVSRHHISQVKGGTDHVGCRCMACDGRSQNWLHMLKTSLWKGNID